MTTLTETVGEGAFSFTLKWDLYENQSADVEITHSGMLYASAYLSQGGGMAVSPILDDPFSFPSPNDVKLHLALLKWIYIRGRELTKNPNMEAW